MGLGEDCRKISFARKSFKLWTVSLFICAGAARAAEGNGFSGNLSLETGGMQPLSSPVETYSYYRVLLKDAGDLDPDLSFNLAGEAALQSFEPAAQISWPLYPQDNALKLETNNLATAGGNDLYSLRLDRAALHWASGPLEVAAGLFKPTWGASSFYKPTDYFFPLAPLQWQRDQALSSEGLDADYFLFDDLSLEGALRLVSGGAAEGVLKLMEKGIGITLSPSLAWMSGRNGVGLEVVGTFPTAQVRLEGVDGLYPDGHTAVNWDAGLSTSNEGVKYTAEVMGDGTGEVLGAYSAEITQATYVFLSVDGKFSDQWKARPSFVAPLEGGPFLLWPQVTWTFAPPWELGFQAQFLLGDWKGPLDLFPGRAGVSLAYSF